MAHIGSSDATGLKEVVSAVNGLADNLASDSTLNNVLAELQNILIELDTKLDENGTIQISPDDVAALKIVTATIVGQPTDYPDAAANGTLASVLSVLQGALDVVITNFPTNYPDTAALSSLTAINATLVDILGETGDNGTLLEAINTKLAGILSVTGSVSVSNFPTQTGLTDAQLRASAVATKSGLIKSTTYSLSGAQAINTLLTPATVTPEGMFLTIKNLTLGTGVSGTRIEFSEDGTAWFLVPNIVLNNGVPSYPAATASTLGGTAATWGLPVTAKFYRILITAAQSAGTTSLVVTEYAAAPALFNVTQNVNVVSAAISTTSNSPLQVSDRGSAGAITTFAATTATGLLKAGNASRKALIIRNEGPADLYVACSGTATASTTAYTYLLQPGATAIEDAYQGPVAAITLAGTATARVTEVS